MAYTNIQTPLQIVANFLGKAEPSPGPYPHPLGGPQATFTPLLLANIGDEATRKALASALSTPISDLFHQAWTDQYDEFKRRLVEQIIAKNTNSNGKIVAYDIVPGIPLRGQLRAKVDSFFPDPSPVKTLSFSYLVPNITAVFRRDITAFPDPYIRFSCEAELILDVVVFNSPAIQLTATSKLSVLNMKIEGAGPGSKAILAVIEVGLFLVGFLGALANTGDLPGAVVIGLLASSVVPRSFGDLSIPRRTSAIQYTLDQLSQLLKLASEVGFTQLDVKIADNVYDPGSTYPGKVVEFDITHPTDKTQILEWNNSPFISSIPIKGRAGSSITVIGLRYPPAKLDRLYLTWTYSPTGSNTSAEVQYGVAGPGKTEPPTKKSVRGPGGGPRPGPMWRPFELISLMPDTTYGIRSRNFDIDGVIAGNWSDWIYATTRSTTYAQIALNDRSGNRVAQGTLDVTSEGSFNGPFAIPTSTVPGTYDMVGSYGGQTDTTSIIIVAADAPESPELLFVQGIGGPVISSPEYQDSTKMFMHGLGFQPGVVRIEMDRVPGETVVTGFANSAGMFDLELPSPPYVNEIGRQLGEYVLNAIQGDLRAQATYRFQIIR